jgi:hypothetical protein
LRLPKRDAGCLKRICGVQLRFTADAGTGYRVGSFLQDPFFAEALELFALSCTATGRDLEALERWRSLVDGGRRPEVRLQHDVRAKPAAARPQLAARSLPDARRQPGARLHSAQKPPPRPAREGGARGRGERGAGGQDRGPSRAAERREQEPRPAQRHDGSGSRRKKSRDRRRGRTQEERQAQHVEEIEPEQIDLSAFDVELDPHRVPTFGSIVEGQAKKKKRSQPATDDDYKPPPPPGEGGPPPPAPPGGGDSFGDW